MTLESFELKMNGLKGRTFPVFRLLRFSCIYDCTWNRAIKPLKPFWLNQTAFGMILTDCVYDVVYARMYSFRSVTMRIYCALSLNSAGTNSFISFSPLKFSSIHL